MASPKQQRQNTAPVAIDCSNDEGVPLDYSFRNLISMTDIHDEEPRNTGRKLKKVDGKVVTRGVRLNNNHLTDLVGMREIIAELVADPDDIAWLDLSFNDLTTIDPVLREFPKLRMLYLHGNHLDNIEHVVRLGCIPDLKTLTLHGNPIEDEKGYRLFVISCLPNLKALDFSGVTKADRSCANTWHNMNIGSGGRKRGPFGQKNKRK